MSLNGNYVNYEPPKSDLLQKYLMKQGSTVPKNNTQTQGASVQNPYNPPSAPAPALHTAPQQDIFAVKKEAAKENKKDTAKSAKVAAASLGGAMALVVITLFGKTNAGRQLAKKAGSIAASGYEKLLHKLRDTIGSDKVDNAARKFYEFRDNKLAKFGAVPENIVNGKDVFSRNAADIVTGRRLDTSKMTGFKKTAAEAYKKTVGRILSWFHLLDRHSTRLYESESIKGGVKKYIKTSSKYGEYSATTLDELKKVLSANPDKKFKIGGREQTGSELLKHVESLFDEVGEKVTGLAYGTNPKTGLKGQQLIAQTAAGQRMSSYNNALKGLDESGKKVTESLTERTTAGFMEKIRGKKFSDLLTEPVAGTILKDDKTRYAEGVKSAVDSITRTTSTAVEETIGDIAGLKKLLGTSDLDTYTEIDKTLRFLDKYKHKRSIFDGRFIFDGTASSAKAQQEICSRLDDLISHIQKTGNPNAAEAIKTINGVKQSLSSIKGGKADEIMDIAREVLDSETYNRVVLPKYKTFHQNLQAAYHNEVSDVVDKLRDINCGSAPTDFMTLIGSTALLGVYTAQAENNDERVSLGLTTGIPLLTTVSTNLMCAIKSISGGKSLAVSLLAGAVTKKVCDGLNKAFRKSRGLDENAKPSVVTIDDYIPYKNKFGEIFMVPAGADINMLNENTGGVQPEQMGAVRLS